MSNQIEKLKNILDGNDPQTTAALLLQQLVRTERTEGPVENLLALESAIKENFPNADPRQVTKALRGGVNVLGNTQIFVQETLAAALEGDEGASGRILTLQRLNRITAKKFSLGAILPER